MSSRLSRIGSRVSGAPRLVLAALLLAIGAVSAVASAAPPAAGAVLVTTHALAAGATVAPGDVRVTRRPSALGPTEALTAPNQAVGRRVIGAVASGEVVTTLRLAPAGFAVDLAAGRSAVAVTVAPPALAVLTVGDAVDVVAATGDQGADGLGDDVDTSSADATISLARSARVLAVWPAARDGDNATIVVDVTVDEARRLAVIGPQTLVGLLLVAP